MKRKFLLLSLLFMTILTGCKGETTTQSQSVSSTEVTISTTTAAVPVSDDEWNDLTEVYDIIADNYINAQNIVDTLGVNASDKQRELVKKAADLVEFGKVCEREGLTGEEARNILDDMITTSEDLLALLLENGIEPVIYETNEHDTETQPQNTTDPEQITEPAS